MVTDSSRHKSKLKYRIKKIFEFFYTINSVKLFFYSLIY